MNLMRAVSVLTGLGVLAFVARPVGAEEDAFETPMRW